MKKFVFILLILLISGCTTGNITYTPDTQKEGPYKVIKVVDGDTLDINNSERIRLSGINTPETGECYYQEAKEKLAELVLNRDIFLEKDRSDTDKYGRVLRYVYINDILVNSLLVEKGYARVYDKYSYDTKRYDELKAVETIAINNNLGVWSCKDLKEGCLYVSSKSSDTYHKPDCKFAKKIKPENLICFKSEEKVKDLNKCKTCLG